MVETELGLQSSSINPEGGKMVRLPHKNIQTEYLISILMVIGKFDQVLAESRTTNDPRPKRMARQIVNRILDDEIKYKLLDTFDKKLAEVRTKGLPAEEELEEVIRISQDLVGEVTSYLDEFFAVHRGQEIGDV